MISVLLKTEERVFFQMDENKEMQKNDNCVDFVQRYLICKLCFLVILVLLYLSLLLQLIEASLAATVEFSTLI